MRIRTSLVPASAAFVVFGSVIGCTAILGDFEISDASGPLVEAGTSDAPSTPDAPSGDTATVDASTSRITGVKAVTAGARHTCALTTTNEVYCWGDNTEGQLGLPATTVRSERPVKVTVPAEVKSLVAGGFHTCVTTSTFEAYCWGGNACGQVGAGDETTPSPTPRKVGGTSAGIDLQWAAVAPGLDHTCGSDQSGATYCWGCNASLQRGIADPALRTSKPVNAGTDKQSATAVSAAAKHTCILGSASPVVRCWGTAERGALGDGPPLSDSTANVGPTPANIGTNATLLGTGDRHTCAVDANKNGLCWGDNSLGQLGNPDIAGALDAPNNRIAGGQVNAIGLGGAFTCIISASDGAVRCFGSNQSGELGRGGATDTAAHATPEAVVRPDGPTSPLQATSIGVGREHACAVLAGAGEVVCWGKGSDGQLGDGTAGGAPRTVPVYVLPPL